VLDEAEVLIAGLFSSKRKDHADLMNGLAAEVTAMSAQIVGRLVQRRGISGNKKGRSPGGKANMERPYSSRTLVSNGKLREIAAARVNSNASAVVFFNELTTRQRTVLTEVLGCPVFSRTDLQHLDSSHHHANRPADPSRPAKDNGSC
jgi:hypothetical protein